MLILSRKNDEAIVVGGFNAFERTIKITIIGVKKGRVELGIEADADVPVNRFEVWEQIRAEAEQSILDIGLDA
jgi:carbon storage regulator CsrA